MIIKVIINKAFFTLNPLPTTPLHPISKHDNSNPTLTPPPLLHHLHNYSTPTYITTPATTPITTSTRTTQHNQTYNLQSPSPPPQPDPPNSIDPTTTHHPPNHLTPTPSSTINITPSLTSLQMKVKDYPAALWSSPSANRISLSQTQFTIPTRISQVLKRNPWFLTTGRNTSMHR